MGVRVIINSTSRYLILLQVICLLVYELWMNFPDKFQYSQCINNDSTGPPRTKN